MRCKSVSSRVGGRFRILVGAARLRLLRRVVAVSGFRQRGKFAVCSQRKGCIHCAEDADGTECRDGVGLDTGPVVQGWNRPELWFVAARLCIHHGLRKRYRDDDALDSLLLGPPQPPANREL